MTQRTADGAFPVPRELTPQQEAYDWLLAIGLLILLWVQITLPLLLIFIGVHAPRLPAFPEGGGVLLFGPDIPTATEYLLLAFVCLPLGLRRRYPMSVLGVVVAAAAVFGVVGHPQAMTVIAVMVAIYTVGTLYDRTSLVVATVATAIALLAVNILGSDARFWLAELIRTGSLVAVAAALGTAMRNQRAYIAEVEQRAQEAERTREEEARRRVDEERLRIARELHDITAHSLSVIAVQSGAAAHVIDSRPDEARRSLEAIRYTARDALTELRRMVGVLRGEDTTDTAPHEPASTLRLLPVLADQFRNAGVPVELDTEGELDDVPAVVDNSAYRVVQEALTNVLRHAGEGTKARVVVRVEATALRIEVVDNGAGASLPLAEGHGLAGMRERAAALGGTFEAGPGEGASGFRVAVWYPLAQTLAPNGEVR